MDLLQHKSLQLKRCLGYITNKYRESVNFTVFYFQVFVIPWAVFIRATRYLWMNSVRRLRVTQHFFSCSDIHLNLQGLFDGLDWVANTLKLFIVVSNSHFPNTEEDPLFTLFVQGCLMKNSNTMQYIDRSNKR